MKRIALFAILVGTALGVRGQGIIHSTGDPTTMTPPPNCAASRFYVDDSTQKLYVAGTGSPCTWTLYGSSSGSGTVSSATGGRQPYYTGSGASTTVGGTTTIYIPVSGSDDSAAINAACATGVEVHLAAASISAPFIVTSGIDMNPPCTILGEGHGQTLIKNHGSTDDVIKADYSVAIPGGVNPTNVKGGYIGHLGIFQDPGVTPTAGAAIHIGTGAASGNDPCTVNFLVEDVQINNTYDGLYVDNCSFIGWLNFISVNDTVHSGIHYDNASPAGDVTFNSVMLRNDSGHSTGVIEGRGDVHTYNSLKVNGSTFVFDGTGANGFGQLNHPSFEGDCSAQTNNILFPASGTNPRGWGISGGELDCAVTSLGNYNPSASPAEMSGCYMDGPIGSSNDPTFNCIGKTNLSTINGVTGAFTFTGPGVSCSGLTCVFSSNLATDNFPGSSLSGNWTVANSSFVVSGGNASANTFSTRAWAFWNGVTFPNDQSSQVTIGTSTGVDGDEGVVVRAQGSGLNGYLMTCTPSGAVTPVCSIYKAVSGSYTQIGSSHVGGVHPGDAIRLDATGTTITGYLNNVSIASGTDSTYSSGQPGIQTTADSAKMTMRTWVGATP